MNKLEEAAIEFLNSFVDVYNISSADQITDPHVKKMYTEWKSVTEGSAKNEFLKLIWDSDAEYEDERIELWPITKLRGWPKIEYDFDGNPDNIEIEPLDLENWEIVKLEDDEVIVNAGGDWQEPHSVSIKLINGELKVRLIGRVTNYIDGISCEILQEECKKVI